MEFYLTTSASTFCVFRSSAQVSIQVNVSYPSLYICESQKLHTKDTMHEAEKHVYEPDTEVMKIIL